MISKAKEYLPGVQKPLWPSIKTLTANRMATSIFGLTFQMIGAKIKTHHTDLGPIEYLETPKLPGQETVVFLHGFADSKEGFLSSLLHLYKDFHFIIPDLPGFGASFKKKELTYDLNSYAKWLGDLLRTNEVSNYHLVGNSLGGAISMNMALQPQNTIKTLGIIDCAGVILKGVPSFYTDYFGGNNLFLIHNREEFECFITRVFHRKMLIPWPVKEKMYQQFISNRNWYQFLLEQMTEGVKGFDDPDLENTSLNKKLDQITAKTLVLWGRQDTFFPHQTAQYIHDKLPDSELHIMEKTGHSPQIERPGAFSKAYKAFIQKNSDSKG